MKQMYALVLFLTCAFFYATAGTALAEDLTITAENRAELLADTVWEGAYVSRSPNGGQVRFESDVTLTFNGDASQADWHFTEGNKTFSAGDVSVENGNIILGIDFEPRAFQLRNDDGDTVMETEYEYMFQNEWPREVNVTLRRSATTN
ncbi:MAG: hypothetical protein RIM33_14590 [Alphaproteobacteria bacterium]